MNDVRPNIHADAFPFETVLGVPLSLPLEDFRRLARGQETPVAAQALGFGDIVARKILFTRILGATRDWSEQSPIVAESMDAPWDILYKVEMAEKNALNDILARPSVGAWLRKVTRRLELDDYARPDDPNAIFGEVSALAAIAASRAKVSFTCLSRTTHGRLYLPTMGTAIFKSLGIIPHPEQAVSLRSNGDGVLYLEQDNYTITSLGPNITTEEWRGEHHFNLEATAQCWKVFMDDVTTGFQDMPVAALNDEEVEAWRNLLQRTWQLLTTDYPQAAAEISRRIIAIKPLSLTDATIGATSPDSIGAIAVRQPANETSCADVLIHELAHTKLTRLQQMISLFTPEPYKNVRYAYAPWRDDPRPETALLQGSYSFMQVSEFWLKRAETNDTSGDLAKFESVLWSKYAHKSVEHLLKEPILTENGRLFVQTMLEQLQSRPDYGETETPYAMAAMATADHAALWRGYHLRISDTPLLKNAISSWRAGDEPSPELWQAPVALYANVQASNFRARANLCRRLLVEPYLLNSPDLQIPIGANFADVLLVGTHMQPKDSDRRTERMQDAEHAYTELLNQPLDSHTIRALVGLGLVYRSGGGSLNNTQASKAILKRPELIHALINQGGVKSNEVTSLASWVGQAIP